MKLERFEYDTEKGLIIDGKRYGVNILRVEITGFKIKLYIGDLDFDAIKNSVKDNDEIFNNMYNPLELAKYNNVEIIQEKGVE